MNYKEMIDNARNELKCHCCGKKRPDKLIKITSHDIGSSFNNETGALILMVRYCGDNSDCKIKSSDRDWVIDVLYQDTFGMKYIPKKN